MGAETVSNRSPKLTPMQEIVRDELLRGTSWTEAARIAGYADPSGEVDRLKSNPMLIDAVMKPLQRKAASWEQLGEQGREVLQRNMQNEHNDWCRSLSPPDPEHGWAPCNCWFDKLKPSDGNAAVKVVADVLGRTDPETLADRARKEDAAITDAEAARQFLGITHPVEGTDKPN